MKKGLLDERVQRLNGQFNKKGRSIKNYYFHTKVSNIIVLIVFMISKIFNFSLFK